MRRRIFGKQSKIAKVIEYLYKYLRDAENVDKEYFTFIDPIDSSLWTLRYVVKTAQGKRHVEVSDFYIYYNDKTENVFKAYNDEDLISRIPVKDVSSALQELVDLTKRKEPKYKKYSLQNKWLKWWKQ